MNVPTKVFVLNATTDSDVLLPVVSSSRTAGGALFVQVQWGNGTFEWLKPAEFKAAEYSHPLAFEDDDEFFDAPAGAVLLIDGVKAAVKVDNEFLWQNAVGGDYHQAGDVWMDLFYGDAYAAAGMLTDSYKGMKSAALVVPAEWAEAYGLVSA